MMKLLRRCAKACGEPQVVVFLVPGDYALLLYTEVNLYLNIEVILLRHFPSGVF